MKNRKIMIVEDETVTAEDIRSCLVKSGYTVSACVSSGEEAVEVFFKAGPALVLMDIRLAGRLDGIETARRVGELADVPVVFLTAYSDADILERVKTVEPFGYIVKPFDRDELRCVIEMALVKHERMKEKLLALARQNGHHRARERNDEMLIELGYGFVYHLGNNNLLFYDQEVRLTRKEFLFVRLLAENVGRTAPYSRIESYVWGEGAGVDESTLRIFLWRLRSKIGKELIKNTVGVGYRIDKP